MILYSLYVKEHNATHLKYLGCTTQDSETYKGSGTDWLKHLKEYGDDHSTRIIATASTKEEISKIATEYSLKWNIVESEQWANRYVEKGGQNIQRTHHNDFILTSFKLPKAFLQEIDHLCTQNDWSRSQFFRKAIAEHIKRTRENEQTH